MIQATVLYTINGVRRILRRRRSTYRQKNNNFLHTTRLCGQDERGKENRKKDKREENRKKDEKGKRRTGKRIRGRRNG